MGGQNVQIPNTEEATAMMHRQTSQVKTLLEDMLKTRSALSGVDLAKASNIGQTAVEYLNQMIDLLQKMDETNEELQKQFSQFVSALAEVDKADFRLS